MIKPKLNGSACMSILIMKNRQRHQVTMPTIHEYHIYKNRKLHKPCQLNIYAAEVSRHENILTGSHLRVTRQGGIVTMDKNRMH